MARRAQRAGQYRTKSYKLLVGSLAANVRALRQRNGWTQQEAADHCNMVTQSYQRIEAGSVNVTFTTLARLCEAFEVDAPKLVSPAQPPPRRPRGRPSK